jgi:hypothetical protein
MPHSLMVLASLLLLAAGCRHANLPELPASHGQLSRMMDRYLDDAPEPDNLVEGVSAPMYDTEESRVVVEPAQAPAVMAEALRTLEKDPTEEQVHQALADLAGACRAPLPAACDALRDRWENPKRVSFSQYALPSEASGLKAASVVVIQCQLTVRGHPRDCRVVESAPYGITGAMMNIVHSSVFWPAKFAGHPIEVSFNFLFHIPLNEEPLTPGQEVGWARARTQRFPDSPSAWAHLARALAKFAPEDPAYPEALRRLHALIPDHWWSANELAWHHVRDGRYTEAEPLAKTAWRGEPRNPYVLETHAAVSAGLGRCAEAVDGQRRAVAALPDTWPAPERERFQRTLETYLQQCPVAGMEASRFPLQPWDP